MEGPLDQIIPLLSALLLITALAMTTIRRLRLVALAAGLLALVHVVSNEMGLVPMLLAAAFVTVNLAQLAVLWSRSRKGTMLEEEKALFEHLLGAKASSHQGRLRDLIRWRDVGMGTVLMRQGEQDPPLIYVASGKVRVEADGVEVGVCEEGDFLGEMSLVSGRKASATVTVVQLARIARFDRDALAQYARAVPEVGTAITNALNRGLAAKVERMNAAAARSDR